MADKRGYTLVELVAGFALSIIVLSMITRFVFIVFNSYYHLNDGTEVMQNLRSGMDFLARDLKGCIAITEITDSTVGLVDSDGSSVRYHVNNKVLYRTLNGVVNPVVMGIKELRVRKLDSRLLEVALIGEAEGREYSLLTRISVKGN